MNVLRIALNRKIKNWMHTIYSEGILLLVMVYNIKTSNIGFIDDIIDPKQDDINDIFTIAPPLLLCCPCAI